MLRSVVLQDSYCKRHVSSTYAHYSVLTTNGTTTIVSRNMLTSDRGDGGGAAGAVHTALIEASRVAYDLRILPRRRRSHAEVQFDFVCTNIVLCYCIAF